MRKLQNGQAASRKKHSSVRRPLAPPIATDRPWMSFSTSAGAMVGDFKRMLFPCWCATLHGSGSIGAVADRGAMLSSPETLLHTDMCKACPTLGGRGCEDAGPRPAPLHSGAKPRLQDPLIAVRGREHGEHPCVRFDHERRGAVVIAVHVDLRQGAVEIQRVAATEFVA